MVVRLSNSLFRVGYMKFCRVNTNKSIALKQQTVMLYMIWDTTTLMSRYCNIQIKICAEYRNMLPRPRLVCQEPGLRPIGRSPGVPDKSTRRLGSMSRYSAQILICFIAYIFLIFFIPLWVWLGTLQDCQYAQCPLPLSIVIRMRLIIRQSKLPACIVEVQLAHQNTLWHLSHSLGENDR